MAKAAKAEPRELAPLGDAPVLRQELLDHILSARRRGRAGFVVLGAPGSGRTHFARVLAERVSTGETRLVRGRPSTRETRGAAIAPFAGGTGVREPGDDAAVCAGVLAPLADGGVLIVDNAEYTDDYSAALLVDTACRLQVPMVLTCSDREPLPEAYAGHFSSGDFELVRLRPLSESDARRLVEDRAGGRVEWNSAQRLIECAEGLPLMVRLLVDLALHTGDLVEREEMFVLRSGWVPDPTDWRSVLASRVPALDDDAQYDLLHLVATVGQIHLDDVEALGFGDAAAALVSRDVLSTASAHELGWLRPGTVVTVDCLTRMVAVSAGGGIRSSEHVTRLLEVVDTRIVPDRVHLRYARAAVLAGADLSPGALLAAFDAGGRGASADELHEYCVRVHDTVFAHRPGADPAELPLRRAVASYLSWQGDARRAADTLRPAIDAGDVDSMLLGVALSSESDEFLRADPLLARVFELVEPGSVGHETAVALELTHQVRAGVAVSVVELGRRAADERLPAWLRCDLAAVAAFTLTEQGRGVRALEVLEGFADPVRHDPFSHRGQVSVWHAAVVAVASLGSTPEWMREYYGGASTRMGWVGMPACGAHLAAGSGLNNAGRVADAVAAYRQALALTSLTDPHGFRGIVHANLRRTLLQLSHARPEGWERLHEKVARGSGSGPRKLEIRVYHAIAEQVESGEREPSEATRLLLEELRSRGVLRLELTALHKLWRYEVGIDTGRLLEVADRCDGRIAEAVAAQVRGLTDDDEARRAVELFGEAGRPLLAAEAAMLRARSLEATDAAAADAAAEAAARVVDRLGPVFTPMLGLRSTEDPELSPREQEIAGLVASGRSNREVAERLDLSPRTVDAHMARIMGKLGLHSRRQLRNPVPDDAPIISTGSFPALVRPGGPPGRAR